MPTAFDFLVKEGNFGCVSAVIDGVRAEMAESYLGGDVLTFCQVRQMLGFPRAPSSRGSSAATSA